MGYNLTQINPAYELVKDVVVGTATTSVDLTGLNITKEDDYILVSSTISGGDTEMWLYANGNYTNSNYWSQAITASGTTVSTGSGRINRPRFDGLASGNRNISIAKIKLTNNGYFVYQSNLSRHIAGGDIRIENHYGTSTFTTTSITSLRINAETSNAIAINSRFQLYKRVAPIIADITVSSATTSVDITGFTMDKGSEYILVFDNNNATAGGGHLKLYFNGTYTDASYYAQNISADSTTITPVRYNLPSFAFSGVGTKTFGYISIKLTNNGYATYQSSATSNYGGSSIGLTNRNGTSTFTTTNITSIRILNEGTNAIGVGSRFQLIKLK